MHAFVLCIESIRGMRTYAAAIWMVIFGIAAIGARDTAAAKFLESSAIVCAGAALIGLRSAIGRIPVEILIEASDPKWHLSSKGKE